ncbi:MAG: hypothetical protein RR885_02385 [Oscillospiraceae bacterium]
MPNNLPEDYTADQTCPAVGYQSASICVPVTVTPFAKAGATFTKCCGNPFVAPGKNTCEGTKNGACTFTITQDICVAVPIDFGAVASVGDTFVNCNNASAEDICHDCEKIPEPVTPVKPNAPKDNVE